MYLLGGDKEADLGKDGQEDEQGDGRQESCEEGAPLFAQRLAEVKVGGRRACLPVVQLWSGGSDGLSGERVGSGD